MLNCRVKIISYSLIIFYFLLFSPSQSNCAEIIGPETKIVNNEIHVTTGLSLDKQQVHDLENGISKEITFYIDLFRKWKMWPDEFILGRIIVKTLKADPIKKEYIATSSDGTTIIEKRFNELDSLLKWTLNINDLMLTNIKELESADYFVRITVESRLRRLPPPINYLLFFVPEKEYKTVKDSLSFHAGSIR